MPVGIIKPSNQIKLTNVSLVRLKKGKKRFEIACYKNKVLEYRSGIETDLDNVLQIPSIFLNVSKGQTAPREDLTKAFGDKSMDDMILEILKKGELQVGEKERNAQLERVHNEVIDIVAGKLVDPGSKRVYTTGMIEKALDQLSSQGSHKHEEAKAGDASASGGAEAEGEAAKEKADVAKEKAKDKPSWTGVVTTKSAKSQALDAMKALIAWQPIPVARARMKLRVTCPMPLLKQPAKLVSKKDSTTNAEADGEKTKGTVKERILGYVEEIETQGESGGDWEVVGFVEPGAFKGLGEFIGGETKGKGRVEVLDMAVVHNEE
jgi:ribosome maturation protein SDO1